MCGRYSQTKDIETLQGRFKIELDDNVYVPRYNIAPTQNVLTVVPGDNQNIGQYMKWGLIPSWAKDISIGQKMINARAETLAEKPAFRNALRKRRCLVLADGFYEWKHERSRKVPMRIHLRGNEPFAFAGLYETWKSPTGEVILSCTIITTTPNELMATIHNRMPVILSPDTESLWLDQSLDDPLFLQQLLSPYLTEAMDAYQVSSLVNSPRFDTPDCIAPAV